MRGQSSEDERQEALSFKIDPLAVYKKNKWVHGDGERTSKRESVREKETHTKSDRIRYITHRKCSSQSKVLKVARTRAFAK